MGYMRFGWTKSPAELLRDPEGKINRGLRSAGSQIESRLLSNMRSTKRWQNRTGDLSGSMTAKASVGGPQLRIALTLHEYYGVYVETRWGGRYQSLVPAIRMTLPEAMQIALQEVMSAR